MYWEPKGLSLDTWSDRDDSEMYMSWNHEREGGVVDYIVHGADIDLLVIRTWEEWERDDPVYCFLFGGDDRFPIEDAIRRSGVRYVRLAACFARGDWGTSRWIDIYTWKFLEDARRSSHRLMGDRSSSPRNLRAWADAEGSCLLQWDDPGPDAFSVCVEVAASNGRILFVSDAGDSVTWQGAQSPERELLRARTLFRDGTLSEATPWISWPAAPTAPPPTSSPQADQGLPPAPDRARRVLLELPPQPGD